MAGKIRIALFAVLAAASVFAPIDHDWLTYNPSPSIPPGFYIRTEAAATPDAFVTVRARDVAPAYAALRDFVGPRDRFIKRIAAVAGETVCARDDEVVVRGRRLTRLVYDHAGRALPRWNGCVELRAGEYFLLGDTADSFDSRYFGVVNTREIEGVWRPL